MARGILLVFANPSSPERTEEFNEWYSSTHLHEVLRVPGITSATRYELSEHQLVPSNILGGRRFLAAYEIEAEDIQTVRDRMLATSGDRSHSPALEMDPLPVTLIFEQIGEKIGK
jgi:hypothetical protein